MEFPRKLEKGSPLWEALSMMVFRTGPIAHVLRRGGWQIDERIEEEQAVVLHWFVCLALQHGDQWRTVVAAELKRIGPSTPQEPGEGRAAP
jgi:hypothetical protein